MSRGACLTWDLKRHHKLGRHKVTEDKCKLLYFDPQHFCSGARWLSHSSPAGGSSAGAMLGPRPHSKNQRASPPRKGSQEE